MRNRSVVLFSFIVAYIFLGKFSVSYAATGGILNTDYTARVCYDVTCTTPTPGVLNFRPTGTAPVIVDDVSGLSGMVWGSTLGWINLNPQGAGVFLNATTGQLTGKAWSQVSGWINFNPTGQGVSINTSNGEFLGWAWTGGPNGGWIEFNCASPSTCVKTDWRPESSTPEKGSGSYIDVCKNIPKNQTAVPFGLSLTKDGNCEVSEIDICPNLAGLQTKVPLGFIVNPYSACVSDQVDYCPNIQGIQSVVPDDYIVSALGECLKDASENNDLDVCLNLPGNQLVIPSSYIKENNECILSAKDLCPNISGDQVFVPNTMMITSEGLCVILPIDTCTNIGGIQEVVPDSFSYTEGICLPIDPSQPPSVEIVSYPFIPKNVRIPVETTLLKNIVTVLDNEVDDSIVKSKEFKVDLVTTVITLFGILSILRWLWLLIFLRNWGVVYDASTRKVLKEVEVVLYDNKNNLIKKIKTDKYGRYGFRIKKGYYRVQVTLPHMYVFPAQSLNFEDKHIYNNKVVYSNLYYGGRIKVGLFGRVTRNIPLDPLL